MTENIKSPPLPHLKYDLNLLKTKILKALINAMLITHYELDLKTIIYSSRYNKFLPSDPVLKNMLEKAPQKVLQQDWVAFMSQPYGVEVMVEVDLSLRLK